jgi:glycosyltransferase involved in cell wall biosynthesis
VFAGGYDADRVYDTWWKPLLADLEGEQVELSRSSIPGVQGVAVIVPVLNRPGNVAPLLESFRATNDGSATLYFVVDADDTAEQAAIAAAGGRTLPATRGSTFAQKVNAGYEQTSEPWLFICGDDVRFHEDWLDAARRVSKQYDVIGTNDSVDDTGNPRVASGGHADHWFIRRSYIERYGGCLGKDPVCAETYRHFYSDVETVELAKARATWTPCLDSLVEHLHPDLGRGDVDATYQLGWAARADDEARWRDRRPFIEQQRVGRGKVRRA